MNIFLESDVEYDNDAIIAKLQKILPDAAEVTVKIRSKRQYSLLQQFDIAMGWRDVEKAKHMLEQFKKTLYAPDGTATMKLLRIELTEAGGDDID